MTNLNQALADIRNIRRQVAETTEFRGYGPFTLFATGLIALIAGVTQSRLLPEPAAHPEKYVARWLSIGFFCGALIITQMLARAKRLHSGMAGEMVRMAIEQSLPAGITGVILPFVLLSIPHGVFWMLPGLWQIVFGLGIFACSRCLPRLMPLAGVWFLLTGLACVSLGDSRALAPATMSCAYTIGMTLVAIIHYLAAKNVSNDE